MKVVDLPEQKLIHEDTPVKRAAYHLLNQYPAFKDNLVNLTLEQHQEFNRIFAQENRCRVVWNENGFAEKLVWNDQDYVWFMLRWA